MDRRQFFRTGGALAGCVALAPTPSLSHILSQQETEEQRDLRWVIAHLKEFNDLAHEYSKKNSLFKSTGYFHVLIRQSLMENGILTYISPTSSIRRDYESVKDQSLASAELLNKIFTNYFREHDKYFSVAWESEENRLILGIKLYELISNGLMRKYGIKEPVDEFDGNLFGHDISTRTLFLGKEIMEEYPSALGWKDSEGIVFNTERLDYKIEREFQKYFSSNEEDFLSKMKIKSWEDFKSYSDEKAKEMRGQRIIKSIQYHEATHILLEYILGKPGVRVSKSPNEKIKKDNKHFELRRIHDGTLAILAELIYGEDQHSKLLNLMSLGYTDPAFHGEISEAILRGIEEYYAGNLNRFRNIRSTVLEIGSREYTLPELYKLEGNQIREIAKTIVDNVYRKKAVEGQQHYETRMIYNPVFQN